jgi:serine/threonine protein kinase
MSFQIGQYRILSELGAGGMGVVYRALDVQLNREVALKRLRSEFAASPAVLERFRREAQLQGRLNHPNIAQLYALAQTEEAFCIVMEFVDGVTLSKLLPMHWRFATQVILQTLDGLEYAHRCGVLHRDIKPENIIIDRRGTVKVMDFGIAHAVGTERMTREKSLIGTIEYMSPERILGQPVDGRSDLYAIGIVFFEMLTGRLPSDSANEYDLLRWHVETTAPQVTDFVDVPPALGSVIAKAVAKRPEDRYSSCAEMAACLREAVDVSGSLPSLSSLVLETASGKQLSQEALLNLYSSIRILIEREDLSTAERVLHEELRECPTQVELLSYMDVLKVTRQPSTKLDEEDAQRDAARSRQMLRMIAAERCDDSPAVLEIVRSMRMAGEDNPLFRLIDAHLSSTVPDGNGAQRT